MLEISNPILGTMVRRTQSNLEDYRRQLERQTNAEEPAVAPAFDFTIDMASMGGRSALDELLGGDMTDLFAGLEYGWNWPQSGVNSSNVFGD